MLKKVVATGHSFFPEQPVQIVSMGVIATPESASKRWGRAGKKQLITFVTPEEEIGLVYNTQFLGFAAHLFSQENPTHSIGFCEIILEAPDTHFAFPSSCQRQNIYTVDAFDHRRDYYLLGVRVSNRQPRLAVEVGSIFPMTKYSRYITSIHDIYVLRAALLAGKDLYMVSCDGVSGDISIHMDYFKKQNTAWRHQAEGFIPETNGIPNVLFASGGKIYTFLKSLHHVKKNGEGWELHELLVKNSAIETQETGIVIWGDEPLYLIPPLPGNRYALMVQGVYDKGKRGIIGTQAIHFDMQECIPVVEPPFSFKQESPVGSPCAFRMFQGVRSSQYGFVNGCEEGILLLSSEPPLRLLGATKYAWYRTPQADSPKTVSVGVAEAGRTTFVFTTEAFSIGRGSFRTPNFNPYFPIEVHKIYQ